MPELTADEHKRAQEIAYYISLKRGDGVNPPLYNHESAVGDFWAAAGKVTTQRDKPTQSTDKRRISVQLPYVIPDSRLRDSDVRAELKCWKKHKVDQMKMRNQSLIAAHRSNQDGSKTVLFRGVGIGSSKNHAAALESVP